MRQTIANTMPFDDMFISIYSSSSILCRCRILYRCSLIKVLVGNDGEGYKDLETALLITSVMEIEYWRLFVAFLWQFLLVSLLCSSYIADDSGNAKCFARSVGFRIAYSFLSYGEYTHLYGMVLLLRRVLCRQMLVTGLCPSSLHCSWAQMYLRTY